MGENRDAPLNWKHEGPRDMPFRLSPTLKSPGPLTPEYKPVRSRFMDRYGEGSLAQTQNRVEPPDPPPMYDLIISLMSYAPKGKSFKVPSHCGTGTVVCPPLSAYLPSGFKLPKSISCMRKRRMIPGTPWTVGPALRILSLSESFDRRCSSGLGRSNRARSIPRTTRQDFHQGLEQLGGIYHFPSPIVETSFRLVLLISHAIFNPILFGFLTRCVRWSTRFCHQAFSFIIISSQGVSSYPKSVVKSWSCASKRRHQSTDWIEAESVSRVGKESIRRYEPVTVFLHGQ
jgi:hypothetical protein